MSDATERIGTEAMALVDHLREEYGEDFSVNDVCIVVDISVTDGDGIVNPVTYGCSDPRRWVQVALLSEALDRANEENLKREYEAHEED